jgi:hypothetical protein
MGANAGVATLIDYSQYGSNTAKLEAFKTLLPKVDRNGDMTQRGFFDEMSAAAAIQLRVEIDTIQPLAAPDVAIRNLSNSGFVINDSGGYVTNA